MTDKLGFNVMTLTIEFLGYTPLNSHPAANSSSLHFGRLMELRPHRGYGALVTIFLRQ